jgi:hypothetical protein
MLWTDQQSELLVPRNLLGEADGPCVVPQFGEDDMGCERIVRRSAVKKKLPSPASQEMGAVPNFNYNRRARQAGNPFLRGVP